MERIGNYYKLFSMIINGTKFYFIAERNSKGVLFVFRNNEDAVDQFEHMEKFREVKII